MRHSGACFCLAAMILCCSGCGPREASEPPPVAATAADEPMATDYEPMGTDLQPMGTDMPMATDIEPPASADSAAAGEGVVAFPPAAAGEPQVPDGPGPHDGWDVYEGGDYRSFALERPEFALCRQACVADERCRAWTYVRPGTYGMKDAVCWLKEKPGRYGPHVNAISGRKDS